MPRKTDHGAGTAAVALERASMRPRPDAAENFGGGAGPRAAVAASMRPRPDAAENPSATGRPRSRRRGRFNEAAARCRGKHAISVLWYDNGMTLQ